MELGWIVRLFILHFKKERYYLVYQKTDKDYIILLNITGIDKRKGIDPEYQYDLGRKVDPNYNSIVNLNTLAIIENSLFFKLLRKIKQPEKSIEFPERILNEIIKGIDYCFSNEKFQGNRYEARIL